MGYWFHMLRFALNHRDLAAWEVIIEVSVVEKWAATTEGMKTWSFTDTAGQWCLVELRDSKGQMAALTNPIYINR